MSKFFFNIVKSEFCLLCDNTGVNGTVGIRKGGEDYYFHKRYTLLTLKLTFTVSGEKFDLDKIDTSKNLYGLSYHRLLQKFSNACTIYTKNEKGERIYPHFHVQDPKGEVSLDQIFLACTKWQTSEYFAEGFLEKSNNIFGNDFF